MNNYDIICIISERERLVNQMRDEYDIKALNPRKNPYAKNSKHSTLSQKTEDSEKNNG